MNRGKFSLEVFGDRLPVRSIYDGETNAKQIEIMKSALFKAINTELTERQRFILTEYYFGNRTMTDIAFELGITKSTVSRHVSRAKERLKTSLRYGMYMLWDESK